MNTPATIYLVTVAAMILGGWLVTAAKTRAFWLGWRRAGRFILAWTPVLPPEGSVRQAWQRWGRWSELDNAVWQRDPKFWSRWMDRTTTRMCRYYAGIPVFKNRVFTLP